ncbi:cation:proton antiporter [Helicobacter sp. 23-1046]
MQEYALSFAVFGALIVLAIPLHSVLKIPITVAEILLGIIAAYIGVVDSTQTHISVMANVGLLFLMFLCGMEVDLKSSFSLGKRFLYQALWYFVILYVLCVLVVIVFKLPFIFIAILPVMSLGMIMALIRDYGKSRAWLNLTLKIGIIGELVSIVVLITLEGIYHYGFSIDLLESLLILCGFLIGVVCIFKMANVLFWWFPNLKLFLLPHDDTNSKDIRFVFMLFIVFIAITSLLHLEPVLGAFIAGVIITTYFKYKHTLPKKLDDIGFGFLVPFFFVYVGTTIDLTRVFINPEILLYALYLIVTMFLVRLIASILVFLKHFKSAKNTLLFALSNSMPLTFLVITASIGQKFGVLSEVAYISCIFGAIFEGIFFSIAIKLIHTLWRTK